MLNIDGRTKYSSPNYLELYWYNAQIIFPENPYWRGILSTVDLLIKEASFVKKINNTINLKWADPNLVQGGQLYWAFPFSKGSLSLLAGFQARGQGGFK